MRIFCHGNFESKLQHFYIYIVSSGLCKLGSRPPVDQFIVQTTASLGIPLLLLLLVMMLYVVLLLVMMSYIDLLLVMMS